MNHICIKTGWLALWGEQGGLVVSDRALELGTLHGQGGCSQNKGRKGRV